MMNLFAHLLLRDAKDSQEFRTQSAIVGVVTIIHLSPISDHRVLYISGFPSGFSSVLPVRIPSGSPGRVSIGISGRDSRQGL